MVKADVKRDYYADLDLPSTADPEEIKKQFRLLGKRTVKHGMRAERMDSQTQRSSFIPIATRAMKSTSSQSFKPSKPHMKS